MTSVSDKETDVVVLRKFDSLRNVLSRGDLDGVADIVAQLTGRGPVGKGIARLVCKVGLHHR